MQQKFLTKFPTTRKDIGCAVDGLKIMFKSIFEKRTLSWALYDWANSAFATTVIAGFFPIFFREYWSAGASSVDVTFRLGVASSISSLVIVFMAPILGAIADSAGIKKKLLIGFSYIGILSTLGLSLVEYGHWLAAIVLFVTGSLGFLGANVFYDALLTDVASTNDRIHLVSGLGYGLGYLGGGILFAINVFMVLNPQTFGFDDSGEAVRVSFITVGIWWAVFSIPILLFVKDNPPETTRSTSAVKAAFMQLGATLKNMRTQKTIVLFLLAYWFYIDGVDTVFRMAVDYGLAIGLDSNDLIVALILVQFIGFPAAIAFGKLGQVIGPKQGIYIGIVVYIAATVWAYFITTGVEFFILAIMIGCVIGGIQSLSRSLLGQLIPHRQAGEYFGFFNMVGKSAAVIGPFLVGWTAAAFGTRNSILSVIVLFAIGAYLLAYVNTDATKKS